MRLESDGVHPPPPDRDRISLIGMRVRQRKTKADENGQCEKKRLVHDWFSKMFNYPNLTPKLRLGMVVFCRVT